MRVLYAALRHDPRNPILASGVDYGFYSAIARHFDEVRIVGPFTDHPPLIERGVRKAYQTLTGKRYIKWDFHTIYRASAALNRAVAEQQPDVVFTIFPAGLATYRGGAPVVFNTDLTFVEWQAHGAGFGGLPLRYLNWLEKQAATHATRIIAHSRWGKQSLVEQHGIDPGKVAIVPMPAALPPESIPAAIAIREEKALDGPLRLLLVGRDYHRKGVDIALEVVRLLNERGCPAHLTVCASSGEPQAHVDYVGPYKKTDPQELAAYTGLYRRAHLLLHPARFEPAGIVPGEAAAFATPTVTNDTGGLGTTVAHGESGIVLPKASPAAAYADAIQALVSDAARYYSLCETTRARYWRELNWDAAGERVAALLREAAGDR